MESGGKKQVSVRPTVLFAQAGVRAGGVSGQQLDSEQL